MILTVTFLPIASAENPPPGGIPQHASDRENTLLGYLYHSIGDTPRALIDGEVMVGQIELP